MTLFCGYTKSSASWYVSLSHWVLSIPAGAKWILSIDRARESKLKISHSCHILLGGPPYPPPFRTGSPNSRRFYEPLLEGGLGFCSRCSGVYCLRLFWKRIHHYLLKWEFERLFLLFQLGRYPQSTSRPPSTATNLGLQQATSFLYGFLNTRHLAFSTEGS